MEDERTHSERGRLRPPPPLVALPAATVPELINRRVLVGDPIVGWRPARAAHHLFIRDGQTCTAVISEADYWRAQLGLDRGEGIRTQIEPVDRVWVEHYLPQHHLLWGRDDDLDEAHRQAALDFDAEFGRISHGLDSPPPRLATPAARAGRLLCRRVTLGVADQHEWQPRMATSEPHLVEDGSVRVLVAQQRSWWAWVLAGEDPEVERVLLDDLWIY